MFNPFKYIFDSLSQDDFNQIQDLKEMINDRNITIDMQNIAIKALRKQIRQLTGVR